MTTARVGRAGVRLVWGCALMWAAQQVSMAKSVEVSIPRVSSAPVIDGRADDAVWQQAALFDTFLQASPQAGEPATQKTELRLAHDGRTLYIAVRADERDPKRIVAQQMHRDSDAISFDDHLLVVLDVEGRGRNGFVFQINPNGTQRDGLIFDGSHVRHDWDALWRSEARTGEGGWSAEIAVPLAALGVRPGTTLQWRLNAERWMSAEKQRVRLAHAGGDKELMALAEALPLHGAQADAGGWGLRVKPSLRMTHRDADGTKRTRAEPGLELFHQGEGGLRTT
ncbi:MAG: carbohydrate binding family 9 domain-containing protein, partial [Rhizobacter sp.]